MKGLTPIFIILFVAVLGCDSNPNAQQMNNDQEGRKKNHLAKETSPYLLQHQYNPVDWYPWGDEAFEKAKSENKLVLISVGYSACHWCHVMEHESFENDSIAALMNKNFVCIKVDREERPDVDQVYMNAVQLMTGRGGWPLNCFALPDGRPFYGGTYYQTGQWAKILEQLSDEWVQNPNKLEEYADKLTEGIKSSELVELNTDEIEFKIETLDDMVINWSESFDEKEGGPNRAPKFPLPNNFEFLLKYAALSNNESIKEYALLSLDKMAFGGIYDQIGGGFARYSTDAMWKAPHFEKMLYDNGQLVSLYSQAYQLTKKDLYKDIVYETIEWLKREMTLDNGAFYSSLDADSEGEEGKFYVWTKAELDSILGSDFDVAEAFYNVNAKGKWEHDNYILLRRDTKEDVAKKLKISVTDLDGSVQNIKAKLMAARDKRIRPGLDDKTLTSWNALMLKGLCDAYEAFGDEELLTMAKDNANFILKNQMKKNGKLMHSYKNGRTTIDGFLEDYCFTAEALIALYQSTFDEKWLDEAQKITTYALSNFYDEKSGMFFFTDKDSESLIARKMEVNDNVIPASNSSMAKVLTDLGHLLDRADYLKKSRQMLHNVSSDMIGYGSGYSNWGIVMLKEVYPYFEIAIAGKDALNTRKALVENYIPNRLVMGDTDDKSNLALLEFKFIEGETRIYVCVNKSCQMPVNEVSAALKQLN
ncbi:MAG: hypothetical protein ACI8XB_002911 [Patiriisocius sp.]|jgi:uncharacterized protein YyaL (SSP411 family)